MATKITAAPSDLKEDSVEPPVSPSGRRRKNVLEWDDLRVQTTGADPFTILKGVSGRAVGGQSVAIMGPSGGWLLLMYLAAEVQCGAGSGKTTLLNVLVSGEHEGAELLGGTVRFNDEILTPERSRQLMGYCEQSDTHVGIFSARELITFSAALRMPRDTDEHTRTARVDQVLKQLRLTKVADRPVGDEQIRGLSGGERRRVSIGLEMVVAPQVLVLDELTSGLDSHIAQNIVDIAIEAMRDSGSASTAAILTVPNTSRAGTCLIFTIHQPSSRMMRQFDQLFLMSQGNSLFQGAPLQALEWFASISSELSCPTMTNPAEHLLEIIANAEPKTEENEEAENPVDGSNPAAANTELEVSCAAGEEGQVDTALLAAKWKEANKNSQSDRDTEPQEAVSVDQVSHLTAFSWVLWREWAQWVQINFYRDPYYFWTQLSTNVFMALFAGFMYWDKSSGYEKAQAIFFVIINVSFVPFLSVMVRFPLARSVFNREKASGYYSTGPFFWAYFFVDIPMQVVMTLSFTLINYWMVGFRNDWTAFWLHNTLLYLTYQNCQSLGLLVTAGFPTVTGSLAVGTSLIILFMSFCGGFLPLDDIPPWFEWVSYISFMRYAFEGLVAVEMDGSSEKATTLDFYGMKDQVDVDIFVLIAMVVVYRALTYPVLMYTKGNTSL